MKKERIIVGFLLGLVGTLTLVDIIEDSSEGASFGHLSIEVAIATASIVALVYLVFQIRNEKIHSRKLEQEKHILREIASKYRQKSEVFVEGLSGQIDQTFNTWKLSHAERDIALFLLKGLSPKNIAEIRNSSEKTVRHQISSTYKKAGLSSREELTAYFLEDLLSPVENEE
jgi:DNA-binding NarL/FixJ family response regulator